MPGADSAATAEAQDGPSTGRDNGDTSTALVMTGRDTRHNSRRSARRLTRVRSNENLRASSRELLRGAWPDDSRRARLPEATEGPSMTGPRAGGRRRFIPAGGLAGHSHASAAQENSQSGGRAPTAPSCLSRWRRRDDAPGSVGGQRRDVGSAPPRCTRRRGSLAEAERATAAPRRRMRGARLPPAARARRGRSSGG